MIALSVFPPAWFWVMNPLVKAHKKNVQMVKDEQMKNPEKPYYKGKSLLRAERVAHAKLMAFQISMFVLAGKLMMD